MLTELFFKAHPRPALTDAERMLIEGAASKVIRYQPRQQMVREAVPLSQCTLVIDGTVYRYKDTADGKRQLLAIHFPGDFVDLHSYPLKRLEHSVAALTEVQVVVFSHPAIRELMTRSLTITELFWRSTLVDAAMNREWLVSVGGRRANARLAHLFCEAYLRLKQIGRVQGWSFDFPLNQADLGECLGLTSVHTNRMLRQLREMKLVEFRHGRVTILDWDGLQALGDFDPTYLFLD